MKIRHTFEVVIEHEDGAGYTEQDIVAGVEGVVIIGDTFTVKSQGEEEVE